MSRLIVILGYPLKHSLSPVFQQAALDALGLDLRYEAWEVAPAGLGEAVARLRGPEMAGANVTVPHKEAVIPLLDGVVGQAEVVGAVNTIVKQGGKLIGHNTDVPGFLQALRGEGGVNPAGKRALLLGAGGAARAVAYALLKAEIAALYIANRSGGRGEALAQEARRWAGLPSQQVQAIPWGERERFATETDLLVNTTTLGMAHAPQAALSPLSTTSLRPGVLVYDLVYNPLETPLLRESRKAGARTLSGLAMLIYQGAASFELWTGRPAPVDIMFKAARQALEE